MRYLLLHSPFLGPSTWGALSAALARQGCEALAPDLRGALDAGAGTYARVAEQVCDLIDEETVVVVHSGAGGLVPSLERATRPRLRTVLFLDGLMPYPGCSWFDTLPPATAERLRALAVDGMATPWPTWLPSGALEQLLPDGEARAALVAEAPAAPLAFLEAPAPEVAGWAQGLTCAYLQLSPAYADETKLADGQGWAIERFDGHHLSLMTEPEPIAAALLRLAARIG